MCSRGGVRRSENVETHEGEDACLRFATRFAHIGCTSARVTHPTHTAGHDGLARGDDREAEGEDTRPADGERGRGIGRLHRQRRGTPIPLKSGVAARSPVP